MKSHVSLEQHHCVLCDKEFDTGSILLDKRLKKSIEHHTVTGVSLCPECAIKPIETWILAIEATPDDKGDPELKTGRTMWIKRGVFPNLPDTQYFFIKPEDFDHITRMIPPCTTI